ncbi:hypothetical protein HJC23_010591 [Cyclotella cryptica]|uniref:Uncharacterized protein n=1 Tax=Cyclotella cryptica TaxID=29204 RepID=A0ABD3PRL4_9STRA
MRHISLAIMGEQTHTFASKMIYPLGLDSIARSWYVEYQCCFLSEINKSSKVSLALLGQISFSLKESMTKSARKRYCLFGMGTTLEDEEVLSSIVRGRGMVTWQMTPV